MDRSRIEKEKARIMKEIEKHLKENGWMDTVDVYEQKVETIKKAIDLTRNLKTELKEIILEAETELQAPILYAANMAA
ncbi:unnamed protein product [Euphydryas editha]|uniref:Uncharacterized protein n=1 Tax=Euphydryas editha TaxID=104508 RepID=A0AAU9V4L3_EUPED|nr:unnamed protein product [Euphydryas editha]